jgi:hypothetical protein
MPLTVTVVPTDCWRAAEIWADAGTAEATHQATKATHTEEEKLRMSEFKGGPKFVPPP